MTWAIGVLAMSILMREKWGYYMSMALFVLWDYWEVAELGSAGYTFIIPVTILGLLMYRIKEIPGLTLSVVLALVYWFQVNMYITDSLSPEPWTAFIYVMYAMGPALMITGKLIRGDEVFRPSGVILTAAGWLIFIVPLLSFSWPFSITEEKYLLSMPEGSLFLIAQFALFIIIASAGVSWLRKEGISPTIYIPFIASAVLLIVVPHYNTTARMVSTHLVITVIIASSLGTAYNSQGDWGLEKGMAFTVTLILVLFKWLGFTGSSFGDSGYTVAYLVGFIIFATVIFLINRLVKHISPEKIYPSRILDILASVLIWITIYTASFKIEDQKSIFSADTVVIVMIFLFIALAVLLYMYLLSELKDNRIIIYLSMAVFISSGITMFIAGEGVSWIVYSLVFNVLLFITTGTWLYYSTVIQSRALLNIAICAFLAHIATRYYDLFWDMLSGSVLFITTGFLGLAGGYLLEKKRRQLIESFEEKEAEHE